MSYVKIGGWERGRRLVVKKYVNVEPVNFLVEDGEICCANRPMTIFYLQCKIIVYTIPYYILLKVTSILYIYKNIYINIYVYEQMEKENLFYRALRTN